MKKSSIGFLAVILAAGLSAYTAPRTNATTVYDWVDPSNTSDTYTGTRANASLHYHGCDQGTNVCAEAFEEGTQIRAEEQDLKFIPR